MWTIGVFVCHMITWIGKSTNPSLHFSSYVYMFTSLTRSEGKFYIGGFVLLKIIESFHSTNFSNHLCRTRLYSPQLSKIFLHEWHKKKYHIGQIFRHIQKCLGHLRNDVQPEIDICTYIYVYMYIAKIHAIEQIVDSFCSQQ